MDPQKNRLILQRQKCAIRGKLPTFVVRNYPLVRNQPSKASDRYTILIGKDLKLVRRLLLTLKPSLSEDIE